MLKKTKLIKNQTGAAIQKVVQNTEELRSLEIKAGEMEDESAHFQSESKALKRHFWWKNQKFLKI